jgi:hypothetical protein
MALRSRRLAWKTSGRLRWKDEVRQLRSGTVVNQVVEAARHHIAGGPQRQESADIRFAGAACPWNCQISVRSPTRRVNGRHNF